MNHVRALKHFKNYIIQPTRIYEFAVNNNYHKEL